MNPKVSVIMTVYNGEKYIKEAVNSILNQTFNDFELIIINDASTDNSPKIIESYKDPRILQINNKINLGTYVSANKGIKIARGKYIARMDADDVSLPDRFEKQIDILDNNSNLVIVGSSCKVINTTGDKKKIWKFPSKDIEIRWMMLFHNSFVQSSVMIRANIMTHNKMKYRSNCVAQDYELWSRLLNYGQGCNINETLVMYRLHDNQLSKLSELEQRSFADRISQANLKKLGVEISISDIRILRKYFYCFPDKFNKEDVRICKLLLKIVKKFIEKNEINREFSNKLTSYWINKILYQISKKELLDFSRFGLFATMIALNTKCVLGHLVRRSKKRINMYL